MSMERKTLIGRVASHKMQKTVVVEIEQRRRHPLYNKIIHRRRRLLVHDEADACQEGDLVRIQETRPLSRLKRWRVLEILERAD